MGATGDYHHTDDATAPSESSGDDPDADPDSTEGQRPRPNSTDVL